MGAHEVCRQPTEDGAGGCGHPRSPQVCQHLRVGQVGCGHGASGCGLGVRAGCAGWHDVVIGGWRARHLWSTACLARWPPMVLQSSTWCKPCLPAEQRAVCSQHRAGQPRAPRKDSRGGRAAPPWPAHRSEPAGAGVCGQPIPAARRSRDPGLTGGAPNRQQRRGLWRHPCSQGFLPLSAGWLYLKAGLLLIS